MQKKDIIITSVILVLFILLSSLILNHLFDTFDLNVASFWYSIRGNKYGFWYYFSHIVSNLITYGLILIFLIVGFLLKFDLRYFMFLINVLVSYLFNTILKLIINRPRPSVDFRWASESSSSFPSGHSATVVAISFFLIFLALSSNISKTKKIIISISFSVFSILVMTSRMVLGMHYLTDVLGGALQGALISSIAVIAYKMLNKTRFNGFRGLKKSDL